MNNKIALGILFTTGFFFGSIAPVIAAVETSPPAPVIYDRPYGSDQVANPVRLTFSLDCVGAPYSGGEFETIAIQFLNDQLDIVHQSETITLTPAQGCYNTPAVDPIEWVGIVPAGNYYQVKVAGLTGTNAFDDGNLLETTNIPDDPFEFDITIMSLENTIFHDIGTITVGTFYDQIPLLLAAIGATAITLWGLRRIVRHFRG